jgi:hypothetical protein
MTAEDRIEQKFAGVGLTVADITQAAHDGDQLGADRRPQRALDAVLLYSSSPTTSVRHDSRPRPATSSRTVDRCLERPAQWPGVRQSDSGAGPNLLRTTTSSMPTTA